MKRTGALLVAVFLTLTLLAPQSARADSTNDSSINSASDWIAKTWKDDNKKFFAQGTIADGVIALSAANREPDTVRAMLIKLKEPNQAPLYVDGYPAGLAKIIMMADIAGQNPRTFLGCDRDLVKELQAMVKNPIKAKEYWGPYLIAIALTRAGEQVPSWVMEEMLANQDEGSGGFGYTRKGRFIADPDYTAVGISAMNLIEKKSANSAFRHKASTSVDNAALWSNAPGNSKQDPAGNQYWETYSAANSTGMLASALGEAGRDVESPVAYLTSQQDSTGFWTSSVNSTSGDVMATTQAVLGVIGEGYGTARSTQVPELVTCGTTTPAPEETVYNTEGYHFVNGREWKTTCEPYSQTTRCRTNIKAKTVKQVNGRFVASTEYVFNNLTYLPSPRSIWKNNPLGGNGKVKAEVTWTAPDERRWRTVCDTPATGRNGCRTYVTSRVIDNVAKPGQPVRYAWVTKEIFNNMVQFS